MLTEQRRQLVIAHELFRLLLNGTIADATEVRYLQEVFDKFGPTFLTYEPVQNGQVFPVEKYNEQQQSLLLDLQFLYQQLYDIASRAIAMYSGARVQYNQYKNYTSRILEQLRLLAAASKDLEDNFALAFDNFSSLQKTDLSQSTPGIVSLDEGCLALPYREHGHERWAPTIEEDLIEVELSAESLHGDPAVLETPAAIFSDTRVGWVETVYTDTDEAPTISITAPVGGKDKPEVTLNQISVLPYAAGNMSVRLYHSLDKENWHDFEGYEAAVYTKDADVALIFEFPVTTFRYLKIVLTKDTPDSVLRENEKQVYRWVFGLRSVSFFTIGRISYGVYYSKPFDLGLYPEVVSLETSAQLPKDTSVLFSIAMAENGERITDYLPIRPAGFQAQDYPSSLVFTRRKLHQTELNSSNATSYLSWHGIDFYKLGELEETPVFGSASLYRGFQGWTRVSQGQRKWKHVENVFISFASSDLQPLYLQKREIPSASYDAQNGVVELSLLKPVAHGDGWSYIPPANSTLRPMYSVAEVLQHYQERTKTFPTSGQTMTYGPITGSTYPKIDLTQYKDATGKPLIRLNFILSGDDKPVLKRTDLSNPQTYLEGIDYVIDTKDVGGRQVPIGTITIPAGSQLGQAATSGTIHLSFTYTLDQDVTSKVTKAEGNIVRLEGIEVEDGDTFEIAYNYVPTPPHGIIGSSVRIKPEFGDSPPDQDYVEGRDYKLNLKTGWIERVHTGKIPTDQGVFADFSVNDASTDVEQFYTWLYQPQETPLRVRLLQPPTPDLRVSEAFYLIKGDSVVDLTQAREWVDLPRGWYQFLVYSKTPENGDCLLYKVQQLVNLSGYAIFKHRGQLFSIMTAERAPRKQVTFQQLKKGTLKSDHSVFAITDENEIIINYEPGQEEEILYLEPSQTQFPSAPDSLEYRLDWQSSEEISQRGSQLLVKCELIGTEQTPKVYSYVVKAR